MIEKAPFVLHRESAQDFKEEPYFEKEMLAVAVRDHKMQGGGTFSFAATTDNMANLCLDVTVIRISAKSRSRDDRLKIAGFLRAIKK